MLVFEEKRKLERTWGKNCQNRKCKRNPHVTPGRRNLTQATVALSSLRQPCSEKMREMAVTELQMPRAYVIIGTRLRSLLDSDDSVLVSK